jgi:hypothetical protein
VPVRKVGEASRFALFRTEQTETVRLRHYFPGLKPWAEDYGHFVAGIDPNVHCLRAMLTCPQFQSLPAWLSFCRAFSTYNPHAGVFHRGNLRLMVLQAPLFVKEC